MHAELHYVSIFPINGKKVFEKQNAKRNHYNSILQQKKLLDFNIWTNVNKLCVMSCHKVYPKLK